MSDHDDRWEKADPEGYLRQRIGYLENRLAALSKTLDMAEMNKMALTAALQIEEAFVGAKSTKQRRAQIQLIVRWNMETVLYGEPAWNRYDLHNVSEPVT